MKKLLTFVFTLCAAASAFAYDACIDGIYYNFSGSTAAVTNKGNNSYFGDVVIPETVEYNGKEYSVTSIGNYAFSNCSSLQTVTIPEGVTSIGDYAFYDCRSLQTVTIPEGVTSIGNSAFRSCRSLQTVTIPEGVTSIGDCAFYGCSSLKTVTIPEGVTSIGDYAFQGCSSLQTVTIPASVTSIGDGAFSSSSSLVATILGETPATLGSEAFHENAEFFVPGDAVDAYRTAWVGCVIYPTNGIAASVELTALPNKSALHQVLGLDSLKKITSLTISGTINGYDIMMMRNQMPNLFEIDLSEANIVANDYEYTEGRHSKKDTLTSYSFTGTGTHIHKAILPASVVCIEANIFNTPYLREVVLPKNLKTICANAFNGCAALSSIILPEGLVSIGGSAFQGAGLKEVTIPASVETIGSKAFAGDDEKNWSNYYRYEYSTTEDGGINDTPWSGGSLRSVTIPANSKLKSISYFAFAGNNSLKTLSILGDSIKTIGTGAFCRCQLDTLILPPNLEGLNILSFGYCTGLKYVVMPNSLTEVCNNAFMSCTKLDDVKFSDKLTKIGHHAFADCTNLRNVDIPGLVTDIEEYAFKDCNVQSVYSYLFDPFTIGQNTFSAYANANAMLHVPNVEDTEMKYLYDTQWSQFVNRERMDKSMEYHDFYATGDVNIASSDDPLQGKPNANLYAGAGLTIEDSGEGNDTIKLGNITIESDGADQWGSVIAGCNVQVDTLIQHVPFRGKKWYFMGFPFDVHRGDMGCDCKYAVYEYDGKMRADRDTTGWKRVPNEQDHFEHGHGYIFQFNFDEKPHDVDFRVPSPNFCDMSDHIVLHHHEAPEDKPNNDSWNYVSNPYLGYYDINDLNTTSPITVWDVDEGNYRSVRPGDDEYYFSPYEGFFMQNAEEGDFNLAFDREKTMTHVQMDEHRNAPHGEALRRKQKRDPKRAIINLTLSSDSLSDNTRVVINEGAKMSYEIGVDAAKFLSNENSVPQIFSYDEQNVQYAINERPMESSVVELGLRIPAAGTYTIEAARMDTMFYLLDREKKVLHDFENGVYSFSSGAGLQSGRFALVRQYSETATDVEQVAENVEIEVTDGGLLVHGTTDIKVYNAAGVLVVSGERTGVVSLPAGVYVVVANENSTKYVVR